MDSRTIDTLFDDMTRRRVLIVGDVMVDAYLWGKVDRISPEAPVPVFLVTNRENRLGGAANVALNVAALGAEPVICATIGRDVSGESFRSLLKKRGMTDRGIVECPERPTTVKTRVISGHQHIVRVDEEAHHALSPVEEQAMIDRISELMETAPPDVVIFEDYNKGALTARVIEHTIAIAERMDIPTAVDPKKDNFFTYRNVTLFKPNLKELAEGLKMDIDRADISTVEAAVDRLEQRLSNKISLVTLSEKGVFVKHGDRKHHLAAHVRNIADVSGAGDTVISVAALALAAKVDIRRLAALSNLAGGLVCEHVGVVPVNRDRLKAEALEHLAADPSS